MIIYHVLVTQINGGRQGTLSESIVYQLGKVLIQRDTSPITKNLQDSRVSMYLFDFSLWYGLNLNNFIRKLSLVGVGAKTILAVGHTERKHCN